MSKEKIRKKSKKFNKSQLLMVGSLLLILTGSSLIFTKHYINYRDDKEEQVLIDEFIDEQKDIVYEQVVEENIQEEIIEENEEQKSTEVVEEYIAVIEIPKISLRKGLYNKNSSLNNVDKNIQILKESDMPDKINGNFILAGHNGTSKISYFRNLKKLQLNDISYIYYNGGRYVYKLVNIYEIEKNGKANIIRNASKTTLTLITCKSNEEKQLVFIFELCED